MRVSVKSLTHPKFGIFQVLEEPLTLVVVVSEVKPAAGS